MKPTLSQQKLHCAAPTRLAKLSSSSRAVTAFCCGVLSSGPGCFCPLPALLVCTLASKQQGALGISTQRPSARGSECGWGCAAGQSCSPNPTDTVMREVSKCSTGGTGFSNGISTAMAWDAGESCSPGANHLTRAPHQALRSTNPSPAEPSAIFSGSSTPASFLVQVQADWGSETQQDTHAPPCHLPAPKRCAAVELQPCSPTEGLVLPVPTDCTWQLPLGLLQMLLRADRL